MAACHVGLTHEDMMMIIMSIIILTLYCYHIRIFDDN